jgi:hypothetical protein
MSNMPKSLLGFRLEAAEKAELEQHARAARRSMSSLVELIVARWLKENSAGADPLDVIRKQG